MTVRIVQFFLLLFSFSCICSSEVSIGEVSLLKVGSDLVCSSKGIYPKPSLTWSFSPWSTETEDRTTVHRREDQLYDISSSVRLPHSPPHKHSCNISTLHSWSSASYRTAQVIDKEATLSCSEPTALIKSLIWRFNDNETILTWTGSGLELVYNETWRPFVSGVSESGHLILKNLTSDQQGLYSCVLSTDSETYIMDKTLKIPAWITVLFAHLLVLFIFALVIVSYYCIWGKELLSSNKSEPHEVRKPKQRNGNPNENIIISCEVDEPPNTEEEARHHTGYRKMSL